MVRRKEEVPVQRPEPVVVRSARPRPAIEELAEAPVQRNRQPKARKASKTIFVLIAILLLLGIGWIGAKMIINASQGGGGIFAALFGGTELKGEERGQVNFLLLGMPGEDSNYDGPTLTDTFMVASFDVKEKKVNLFSLPRDLYVKVPGAGSMKLNAVYQASMSALGDGVEPTKAVATSVLGIPIDYYARITFEGMKQLVDELGGVTVEVDKDLHDEQYPDGKGGYITVDIKAGTQRMDGETALKYARSRHSTSDFDRARRQQQIMMAIRERATSLDLLKSPKKALAVYNILRDNIKTDMSVAEMERLIELGKDLDPTKVTTKVFDNTANGFLVDGRINDQYVLQPVGDSFNAIHDYVKSVIEGTVDVAKEQAEAEKPAEPLKLEVLNGTNVTGLAGKVANTLKAAGHTIITVGNNATRGVEKTVVYDLSGGKRSSDISKLAAELKAEISAEKPTSTSGAEVRIVVGADKQQ